MYTALISLATEIGTPLVRKILMRKLGPATGELAADVVDRIAEVAGLPRKRIEEAQSPEDLSQDEIERTADAIREVEHLSPEMIQLYQRELEAKTAILAREDAGPLWLSAWRPLGMYGLGILWFWNVILLHVANAIWKIALPMMDLSILLQVTALYLTLYMGGHTVKSVMAKARA